MIVATVLKLPDRERSKSAVLDSLTSASSQALSRTMPFASSLTGTSDCQGRWPNPAVTIVNNIFRQ